MYLDVSGILDKASESVWRMCLECVWNVSGMCLECVLGVILSPECLWIIWHVSGMLDKASESVW